MTKRKRQAQYVERYRNSGKVQPRPTLKGRHSDRRQHALSTARLDWTAFMGYALKLPHGANSMTYGEWMLDQTLSICTG